MSTTSIITIPNKKYGTLPLVITPVHQELIEKGKQEEKDYISSVIKYLYEITPGRVGALVGFNTHDSMVEGLFRYIDTEYHPDDNETRECFVPELRPYISNYLTALVESVKETKITEDDLNKVLMNVMDCDIYQNFISTVPEVEKSDDEWRVADKDDLFQESVHLLACGIEWSSGTSTYDGWNYFIPS